MKSYKVAIIEDEIEILEVLVNSLTDKDIEVFGFATAEDFLYKYNKIQPHIILTDLNLPGKNGDQIIQEVRKTNDSVPILVITGNNSKKNELSLIKLGANDFISKPFDLDILEAKVYGYLSRIVSGKNNKARNVQLEESDAVVIFDGRKVSLTNREFQIFKVLYLNKNELVSRDLLHETGATRSLDVHMSSLRRKLFSFGIPIETFKGKGYKLSA